MWGHADQQEADIVAQLTTPGLGSGPVARRRRLTAAAVLALAFVLLAVLVSRSVSAFAVDVTIHDWLMAHRTATLTTAALAVTATGASSLAVPVVLALALLAGRGTGLGRLLPVVIAAAVLLSGILVRLTVSNVVGRIRPPRGDWAGYAHGYAFPSGHTTTSALTAGVLAGLALERLNGRLRTVVLVLLACWAIAVGLTRAYLGVHWPSDVVGGWLLALAWLFLAAGLLAGARARTPGAATATASGEDAR